MANTNMSESKIGIKDELLQDHEDESSDVEKYMKLASAADEQFPCRGYGAILRGIAKEESQHRKHIKMILDDMDKLAGEAK